MSKCKTDLHLTVGLALLVVDVKLLRSLGILAGQGLSQFTYSRDISEEEPNSQASIGLAFPNASVSIHLSLNG